MFENTLAERARGLRMELFARVSGIGVFHCACPYVVLVDQESRTWMIDFPSAPELAVQNSRGYLKKTECK
jgi:RIO-like serine/threonine protein kinase